MRRIQNFIGNYVAFWRPHKDTYIILGWNDALRVWAPARFQNPVILTKHHLPDAPPVSALVNVRKQRGSPAAIECICEGGYLKTATNTNIPILKRNGRRTDDLPQSAMKTEYVATPAHADRYYATTVLYSLAEPVAMQQANRVKIGPQAIPKRIANIVALDYIQKGEDCPITMMPLDIGSTKVTSCYHVFEGGALDEWMKTNKSCPVCKEECVATATEAS